MTSPTVDALLEQVEDDIPDMSEQELEDLPSEVLRKYLDARDEVWLLGERWDPAGDFYAPYCYRAHDGMSDLSVLLTDHGPMIVVRTPY